MISEAASALAHSWTFWVVIGIAVALCLLAPLQRVKIYEEWIVDIDTALEFADIIDKALEFAPNGQLIVRKVKGAPNLVRILVVDSPDGRKFSASVRALLSANGITPLRRER